MFSDIKREAVASAWNYERVKTLGMTCDLETAAQILGISRSTAYREVQTGRFPVPIRRIGRIYRVPVAGLLEFLEITMDEQRKLREQV